MERRIITTDVTAEDERIETTLRPQSLKDYVGQEKLKCTPESIYRGCQEPE